MNVAVTTTGCTVTTETPLGTSVVPQRNQGVQATRRTLVTSYYCSITLQYAHTEHNTVILASHYRPLILRHIKTVILLKYYTMVHSY